MTQSFLFNEPFQQYHRCHFAEAFFKDRFVAEKLKIWDPSSSVFKEPGIIASEVDVRPVPCTITSMIFFEKLNDPKNEIVHESGSIRPSHYDYIDDILIPNCLRAMILDDANDKYHLYSKSERAEFIFRIFRMLVLGGSCCQYEDDLKIYLNITKALYKTFVRVGLTSDQNDIEILSTILEVVAKKDEPFYPWNPKHPQNIGYLIIDPINREVTTFLHQY
ncbi:cilia- and flagella-associated protein 300-like isoform X2 [Chelonus insularis]|nr:cilia- and flagella-associated protein 300-like isoform X2 [Chelonus insularis]